MRWIPGRESVDRQCVRRLIGDSLVDMSTKCGDFSSERNPMDDPFNIDVELGFLFAQLHIALNAQARSVIARHGDLTLAQWRIIRLVASGQFQGSTGIRKAACIDKSQFSKTVHLLEKNGYLLVSEHSDDKRQFNLALTPKAERAHTKLVPDLSKRNAHLMNALPPEQRKTIVQTIKTLITAADVSDFSSHSAPPDQDSEIHLSSKET